MTFIDGKVGLIAASRIIKNIVFTRVFVLEFRSFADSSFTS